MGMTFKETSTLSQYFKIDGKGPIDIRFAVEKVADLTNGTFSKDNSYNMLMVGVEEDNGIYVLINSSNPASTSSWQKLASASDISGLSGVFTFKGLAESVSPDLKYIVVCTPSTEQRKASPIGAFSDLEGEIYYGWENENGYRFYTDSLVLNDLTKQYERGSDTYEMRSLEYNGDMYYLTTASPIGDDDTHCAGHSYRSCL